jgi:hypothetical protein
MPPNNPPQPSGLQDFLSPKAMLTPGIAAGITVLITNGLCSQFDCPRKFVALIISFLAGALVFIATDIALWQRAIYYVLNSLIIFATAFGINNTVAPNNQPPPSVSWLAPNRYHFAIVPSAEADETAQVEAATMSASNVSMEAVTGNVDDLQQELSRLRAELAREKSNNTVLRRAIAANPTSVVEAAALPIVVVTNVNDSHATASGNSPKAKPSNKFLQQW